MKLNVCLSVLNGDGSLASVETEDGDNVELARCWGGGEKRASEICSDAARRLREAASRFELLAQLPDPYNEITHLKVNKAKVVV